MRANSITRGTLADGRELYSFDDAREAPGDGCDAGPRRAGPRASASSTASTASAPGTEGHTA